MMAEFKKNLPVWKAVGVEPPLSKTERGWRVDERPPAEYMNYLQNKTYESILELQTNAVHKDDFSLVKTAADTAAKQAGENKNLITNMQQDITVLKNDVTNLKNGNGGGNVDTTPPIITANLTGGTYAGTQVILLSSNEIAEIYYTINGSTPTVSSAKYTGPITISSTTTLKFFGKDPAGNISVVQSITYIIQAEDKTAPILTITRGGIFTTNQTVTMSTNEAATIYYTLDGSTPTTTSSTYSAPLTLTNTTTVKAFAKDVAGNISSIQTETYTKDTSPTTIAVTGVALNLTNVTTEQGTQLRLTASVLPINATNKKVTWASSKTNVAIVDTTGLVSAVGTGNSTVTVTTEDGGKTATCTVNVIQAIVGFDYNNLTAYAEGMVPVTFDQVVTYGGQGAGDFVHPSVEYFPSGWNGHNWWMGVNPYAATNGSTENPYIFYSDDGVTWKTPAGAPAPLYPKEADVENNSDAHIFLDYDGVTMHYLNRGALNAGGSMTEVFSSKDGIQWTNRKRIFTSPAYPNYVAPSVCKVNGKYYMFAIDVTDLYHICVLEATDVYGTWTEINRIANGTLGSLWHAEVRYINQEFIIVASTNGINGGNLMLGKFFSVMDKVIVGRNNSFMTPPADKSWNKAIYKSSLVIKNQHDIQIFVGFKGDALNANTGWRVVSVPCKQLEKTLDLSNYVEVASHLDNSEFSQSPGKSTKMDYQKYAFDFTVTTLTNLRPAAFSDSTNELANFYIDNSVLISELWNIVGGTQVKNISYGLALNDRVTMMLDDEFYRLYINNRLVHEVPNNPNKFDNFGTGFGDKNGVVSLGNIKIYKKSEYAYSQERADAWKTEALNRYTLTPNNFILVDEFNRGDGAVGKSDNGVTYEIIGAPSILNNTLKPNSSNNAVLVPAQGNMSISFKLANPGLNQNLGIYLKYTDPNNFIKFHFIDTDPMFFYITNKKAGTERQTKVNNHVLFDTHRNFRLDVVNGVMKIYCDGVFMNSIAIPNETYNQKVGFTSGFAGTQYDYVIIEKL